MSYSLHQSVTAPLVGSPPVLAPLFSHKVPAGFPSPADDYIEGRLSLDQHLIQHRDATFFVRAKGNSMVGAGISVLESWLKEPWNKIKKDRLTVPIIRCDFPYTVQDAGIANTFIALNRNYQPLGSTSENGIPIEYYKDETGSHIWLSKTQIAELGEIPHYLYGGKFNPPWSSKEDAEIYLTRLKAFYQLSFLQNS